jgi:3-oxoacyl-[acyl-carrier-protein] synthase II
MLTPLGNDVASSWENALAGKSGISKIDQFDASPFPSQISGSVKNFDASLYMDAKEARRMDVFIHYGVAAATQAMKDSGLEVTDQNAHRVGVAVGSGIGGLPMLGNGGIILKEKGPRKISPFFIPATIINMASGLISIRFGLKGPNIAIVTACTTGTHNIGSSARMIAYGDADVMVCGGAEMATCNLGVAGFSVMRALSTRNDEPEKASRPWDKDRDGFVLGDGAGALVLEEYEHAKKRGATIYAELGGFGMSADAHHITAPAPEGATSAMQNTLNDAGMNPEDIQYINAHATSTLLGDESEVEAVKTLFSGHAYKLAMSSTKSMTGHLLGATGAVEAIFSVLAIKDQVAPPTINLDNPSEGCDLNFVPHQPQSMKIAAALSNSFGFGGTNASLLFKAIE